LGRADGNRMRKEKRRGSDRENGHGKGVNLDLAVEGFKKKCLSKRGRGNS